MAKTNSHAKIADKIAAMKRTFPYLRNKADCFVFTALCVRANFYKNPSLDFTEQDIEAFIVDGQYDGGVDAILSDPNSEENNLILVQSKYYENITKDNVSDAVSKMIIFYKEMLRGEYQNVNATVQQRFLSLNAEVGEESKVCFVFYTSANQSGIRKDSIEKLLKNYFSDTSMFEVSVLFADDIVEEIKELESRRPTVESGFITIDKTKNFLEYNDDAVIVNVSAFSIKELYAINSINLLSRNLRYFIKKREIDESINDTIKNAPDEFWFRNNGITIVCDDFVVDGRKVRLSNFSIVNGGQTTTLLHKSSAITKECDLYLPCKIIRSIGEAQDDKNAFTLTIAKATNSQKPIKLIDLKSNAPEQIRFYNAMREEGIYYQTKRGEKIPTDYKDKYKNTDLAEVGKLCLAGIFQLPATSRNKPSSLYNDRFYNVIFHQQPVSIIKELLYINYYFNKSYIIQFNNEHRKDPVSPVAFANNARTICIAFVALACRSKNENLDDSKLKIFFQNIKKYDDYLYDIFCDLSNMKSLFPTKLWQNKDKYDNMLSKLFDAIIMSGFRYYQTVNQNEVATNESNFLKNDLNYYSILKADWIELSKKIDKIYTESLADCLV